MPDTSPNTDLPGRGVWHSLLYRSQIDWPDREGWLQQIHARYRQHPVSKPDWWSESVHTTIQDLSPRDLKQQNSSGSHVPESLINLVTPHIQSAAQWMGIADLGSFSLSETWYNAYSRGQWQYPHRHGGGMHMLSGIYYAKHDPEQHVGTRFYHPGFEWDHDLITDHYMLLYQAPVRSGDLIMFPSELGHDVPMQHSDELRITVSFNISCAITSRVPYE